MTFLQPHDRILLTGDSITDRGLTWADDGVHPTPAGCGPLAEAWLDAAGIG